MTNFTTDPGFWQAELLEMLLPAGTVAGDRPSFDAELLRQLSFLPGLKETLMVRQVHALEHATVWVLTQMANQGHALGEIDSEALSGLSTERGFFLYGNLATVDVKRAVQLALRRLTTGEAELAVHPRCGTNLSVGLALTAGLALGATMILPRDPIGQLLGVGMATVTAAYLTPELGAWAQRYVTTALPFNLAIAQITAQWGDQGRSTHFVEVRWVD